MIGRFFTPTPQRKRERPQRCLTTQHAFPRSAIFTFSLWALPGSSGLRMKSEALNAATATATPSTRSCWNRDGPDLHPPLSSYYLGRSSIPTE